MNNIIKNLKRLINQLLGFIPSALPVGIDEFNSWSDKFMQTYKMPTQDTDSIRFVLATKILHSNETAAYKSNFYFFLVVRAAAAKQVASAKFQEIKAAQAAKQAEATATPVANVQN